MKLQVILNDQFNFYPSISVDDKFVKLKKTKLKNSATPVYSATVDVPNPSAKVCVYKYYPYQEKNWFVSWLIYWIIGVFGIFSPRYDKTSAGLMYTKIVNLSDTLDTKLTIKTKRVKTDAQALEVKLNDQLEDNNDTNKFFAQPELYKRRKLISRLGLLTIPAIIATIFVLIAVL